jgi:hypothetical protein
MPKGAISKVMTVDGKQVYVIGTGDGSDGAGAFIFVDTISERDSIITDKFVFVRNAYKNDPTVNRGWAIYIYDAAGDIHWRKVMEEESVDGPWGVQAEILKSVITKAQFAEYSNKTDADIAELQKLLALGETSHVHTNKATLDAIVEKFGQLTYKGRPISGNSYLYDVVVDGALVWKDPTDEAAEEVACEYSFDIATKFAATALALADMELSVVETNGSVSTFKLVKEGDKLVPYFVGIYGGSVVEEVTHVTELPEPSASCVNGVYEVIPSGSCKRGVVNHVFRCVETGDNAFEWVDLTIGVANSVSGVGQSVILACYREEWNKNHIMWEASSDAENVVSSVVVRKIGTAPTSDKDGVVVFEGFVNKGDIFDTVPLTNDQVFYGVFQRTGGGSLISPATAEAVYIDWATIKTAIENGKADALFTKDDTVVIEHNKYGSIECKVIAVESSKVVLAATKAIAQLEFDGREHGMFISQDTRYVEGKDYYRYSVSDNKEIFTVLTPGTDYNNGDTISGTVFEANTSSTNNPWSETYDQINGICHGSATWKGSNLEQYLNSTNLNNWYVPDEAMSDRRGPSYDGIGGGFLAGILDADLRSIISNVRIPMSKDEVVAEGNTWTMVVKESVIAGETSSYLEHTLMYRDAEGEWKFADPEGINRRFENNMFVNDYLGVAPIFVLGDEEEIEQPVFEGDESSQS